MDLRFGPQLDYSFPDVLECRGESEHLLSSGLNEVDKLVDLLV